MNKKILSVLTLPLIVGALVSCGGETPSESVTPSTPDSTISSVDSSVPVSVSEYVPDLTKAVTLKMAVNYDKNTGMKYTGDVDYTTPKGTAIKKGEFKPVYKALQNRLNFTIEDTTSQSDQAVNQFKNDWKTDQYADLACGNVSDIVDYSVDGEKETILDISQYLDKMPNFAKFLKQNAIVQKSITTSKHSDANKDAIYYLPYFDGFSDLEKMTLLRADYVRKLLDGDFVEADFDDDSTLWDGPSYNATVTDSSYKVKVAKSLDNNETKEINKASTTNIVTQQNSLAASDRTSRKMVKQFRDYIDAKYGSQFANRSDLFLGVDSCYDADEMVALMRLVKVSPKALTGNANIEMVPFVPREYNNQRIEDLYRWAGQLWGVRGVESRNGYLYINSDGKVKDARGDDKITKMLGYLHELYSEKLILQDFKNASNYGITTGKFAEALVPGGNEKYSGFMEYDYAQTQGVWNDKAGSKAIAGYDFRPIIGGVAKWDNKNNTSYYHFTESWRSVKSQGWCLNASLKDDQDKLNRALALADYLYSDEGQQLNSFGPESEGYTSGKFNYQGREVAKFTDKALEQLNDSSIGGGSYTNYLRKFVGATLPIGYIKEQGMEYQCTSEHSKNGLAIINKAIEVGTYKHVECKFTEDPFFTIVPSALPLSAGDVAKKSEYESKEKLGSINSSNSTSAYNIWADYVISGFGAENTLSAEAYLTQINTTWELEKLLKIYQNAYDYLIA